MPWESIGSVSTGEMPQDAEWITLALTIAQRYVLFVCGESNNAKLDVMWHDHEYGSYPTLGVWSDGDPPQDYVNECERALEAFDDAIDWSRLKAYYESTVAPDESHEP